MGLGRVDKLHSFTRACLKPTGLGFKDFWCQDEPHATWTHKIHHGPDLREATTFPFIVYSAPLHGAHIQMTFCSETPNGSLEIAQVGTLATLEPHNFASKLRIEMRLKKKLQPLSKDFQRYVTRCLQTSKLGRFSTFSDRESNCQFDFRPFFWP